MSNPSFFIRKSYRLIALCLVLSALVSIIKPAYAVSVNQQDSSSSLVTDVIDTKAKHLLAKTWLDKLAQPEKLLMNEQEIANFNQSLVVNNAYIHDPLALADVLPKQALLTKINKISSVPTSPRYFANGKPVNDKDFSIWRENANIVAVASSNRVQFALVVKRSRLRTFPTNQRVFRLSELGQIDQDLDLFQESGIFPGQAVAVLHQSKDKRWYLVQAFNYLAWLPAADIAIGSREQVAEFVKAKRFITVTGSKVFTNEIPSYYPAAKQLSNIQLDMGVTLPLAERHEYKNALYGQNPFTSYVVKYPSKDEQGKLVVRLLAISKAQDITVGTMAMTPANIIQQAFQFLGERYGWGHDFNGRDCTGFIGEVFKSFGILMPRNSGQQAKSDYGNNIRFDDNATKAEKLAALNNLKVGDLIYIPGHVMMYLGQDKGQPYVIHDVKDMKYQTVQGENYFGTLNGVSVTPLLPMIDYVENITVIKTITGQINE
ncbi:SH3 domain-containing protein [Litorilituus sediminis]|uniref:Glycoside hydrolase n=1 Tax=Litorilituus sediminis TaxID=718192 RepID=A0A4P6P6U7_9GAMM|nr:SH3 domain-containing protein [Litorilituus sediminis]QBG37224.1 glycoside hydrolase [Litorilituus sediminis]